MGKPISLLWSVLFLWTVSPCMAHGKVPKTKDNQPTQVSQRQGDVSFRFSAGPQLYQMSTASGELLASSIGERAFAISLIPEYSYYFLKSTSFFVCLPIEVDVDLVVGTTVGFGLGVGIRQYLNSFFFLDGQLSISLIRRSLGRIEFGGFAFGVGASIPLGERFRLLVIAQIPFNFIDGFLFHIRGYLGLETFF